jgi:integrase
LKDFESIRRSDVATLLDGIEDSSGPVAADFTLKIVSGICNWYATRHENYSSPIVRGMRRSNQKERARDRILNDDELRAVWKRAEANGTFGGLVRLLLLTGQRKDKVAKLRWDDITAAHQ